MAATDLATEVFLALREHFFDPDGSPRGFRLRDKATTQDDPFDEHVAEVLAGSLRDATCYVGGGKLVSPDIAVFRSPMCEGRAASDLVDDNRAAIGIEVKKLEREPGQRMPRATGLDYNSTPPCAHMLLFDNGGNPVSVRGFYLFVCLERQADGSQYISALALCDGAALNQDEELYLSAVGLREKKIGIGTYADGINRDRPMFVFANPLGAPELDGQVSLIHQEDLSERDGRLAAVYRMTRSTPTGEDVGFVILRRAEDVDDAWQAREVADPFPTPANRHAGTQQRGKFVLPFKCSVGESVD